MREYRKASCSKHGVCEHEVVVVCEKCTAETVGAQTTATTGIPKLPPCSCCYAGKFCNVGIIPDTYMCYDAWRQLRAGA